MSQTHSYYKGYEIKVSPQGFGFTAYIISGSTISSQAKVAITRQGALANAYKVIDRLTSHKPAKGIRWVYRGIAASFLSLLSLGFSQGITWGSIDELTPVSYPVQITTTGYITSDQFNGKGVFLVTIQDDKSLILQRQSIMYDGAFLPSIGSADLFDATTFNGRINGCAVDGEYYDSQGRLIVTELNCEGYDKSTLTIKWSN